jgi:hypothetical protein
MNDFRHNLPTAMDSTTRFVACATFGADSCEISRVDVGRLGKTWKPMLHTWEGDSDMSAYGAIEARVARH